MDNASEYGQQGVNETDNDIILDDLHSNASYGEDNMDDPEFEMSDHIDFDIDVETNQDEVLPDIQDESGPLVTDTLSETQTVELKPTAEAEQNLSNAATSPPVLSASNNETTPQTLQHPTTQVESAPEHQSPQPPLEQMTQVGTTVETETSSREQTSLQSSNNPEIHRENKDLDSVDEATTAFLNKGEDPRDAESQEHEPAQEINQSSNNDDVTPQHEETDLTDDLDEDHTQTDNTTALDEGCETWESERGSHRLEEVDVTEDNLEQSETHLQNISASNNGEKESENKLTSGQREVTNASKGVSERSNPRHDVEEETKNLELEHNSQQYDKTLTATDQNERSYGEAPTDQNPSQKLAGDRQAQDLADRTQVVINTKQPDWPKLIQDSECARNALLLAETHETTDPLKKTEVGPNGSYNKDDETRCWYSDTCTRYIQGLFVFSANSKLLGEPDQYPLLETYPRIILNFLNYRFILFPDHGEIINGSHCLLQDVSIMDKPINALLEAVRDVFTADADFGIVYSLKIPDLHLSISEDDHKDYGPEYSLASLFDLYIRLCSSQGIESPEPFEIHLHTAVSFHTQLTYLWNLVDSGENPSKRRFVGDDGNPVTETAQFEDGQESNAGDDDGIDPSAYKLAQQHVETKDFGYEHEEEKPNQVAPSKENALAVNSTKANEDQWSDLIDYDDDEHEDHIETPSEQLTKPEHPIESESEENASTRKRTEFPEGFSIDFSDDEADDVAGVELPKEMSPSATKRGHNEYEEDLIDYSDSEEEEESPSKRAKTA